jgi:hypothetical protein
LNSPLDKPQQHVNRHECKAKLRQIAMKANAAIEGATESRLDITNQNSARVQHHQHWTEQKQMI